MEEGKSVPTLPALTILYSDILGILNPRILVHGVAGEKQPILVLGFQDPTKCILDDWILQPTGFPDSHETRGH